MVMSTAATSHQAKHTSADHANNQSQQVIAKALFHFILKMVKRVLAADAGEEMALTECAHVQSSTEIIVEAARAHLR